MATRKKGEGGRFVSERPAAEAVKAEIEPGPLEQTGVRRVAAPRPKYCRTYARARFAEALPEISEALLREARKGSVAHLKLLMHLTGLDKADVVPRATKKRGKSIEAVLMEQWRRDEEVMLAQAAREAEAAQAAETLQTSTVVC